MRSNQGSNKVKAIPIGSWRSIHGQIRGQIRSKIFISGLRDQYEVKQGVKIWSKLFISTLRGQYKVKSGVNKVKVIYIRS